MSPARPPAGAPASPRGMPVRVGVDTVDVAGVAAALSAFGRRYEERLFTVGEQAAACRVDGARAERYAARFAAKEAVIKVLDAGEAGLGWREIEVEGRAGRPPSLTLHGRAAALAEAAGVRAWALSLSHDGAQACAMVAAWCGADLPPPLSLRAGTAFAAVHGAAPLDDPSDFQFRSNP